MRPQWFAAAAALTGVVAYLGRRVVQLPEVTSALIGVKDLQQLDENLLCLENLEFSEAELRAIDAITLG